MAKKAYDRGRLILFLGAWKIFVSLSSIVFLLACHDLQSRITMAPRLNHQLLAARPTLPTAIKVPTTIPVLSMVLQAVRIMELRATHTHINPRTRIVIPTINLRMPMPQIRIMHIQERITSRHKARP